jgi:hypothetical protein
MARVSANDIRVTNWAELLDLLYQGSWREPLGRYRTAYAYRGNAVAAHDLRSSLARLGGETAELERHVLRAFRKYAQRDAVPGDSTWNWLAVAQHFGAPTRLLDWTYSPFVALHFATPYTEEFDIDGAIWCVDYSKTNALLPPTLKAVLADEGSDVFTAEMLHQAASGPREFDALAPEEFVVFFEPPSLDARIVNQSALFALKSNPVTGLDRWLANHPDVYFRLIIPAELKWEVRDKLDQAGITERVLFPGLDGLSRWLTRYYMPKR